MKIITITYCARKREGLNYMPVKFRLKKNETLNIDIKYANRETNRSIIQHIDDRGSVHKIEIQG